MRRMEGGGYFELLFIITRFQYSGSFLIKKEIKNIVMQPATSLNFWHMHSIDWLSGSHKQLCLQTPNIIRNIEKFIDLNLFIVHFDVDLELDVYINNRHFHWKIFNCHTIKHFVHWLVNFVGVATWLVVCRIHWDDDTLMDLFKGCNRVNVGNTFLSPTPLLQSYIAYYYLKRVKQTQSSRNHRAIVRPMDP